jgi:putative aldouronate transport system permease protein
LYKSDSWIAIYVGSGIWKGAGFNSIIYLAALSSIDPALYESAAMDGAGKFRQMISITIPTIMPTIVIVFILAVGRLMEVGFDHVYMLQNPSVSDVADVISTYNYRIGIQGMQFSFSTALGLFDSIVGLILISITNFIANKFGEGLW